MQNKRCWRKSVLRYHVCVEKILTIVYTNSSLEYTKLKLLFDFILVHQGINILFF